VSKKKYNRFNRKNYVNQKIVDSITAQRLGFMEAITWNALHSFSGIQSSRESSSGKGFRKL